MAEYRLIAEIMKRSESKSWHTARLEWQLLHTYIHDDFDRCICGHRIREICVIRNSRNDGVTEVGNHCVKQFMPHLPANKIFQCLKRVMSDITRPLNREAIEHFHRNGCISRKEYEFYVNTRHKRQPSGRQLIWRIDINRKVLEHVSRVKTLEALATAFAPTPDINKGKVDEN